MMWRKHVIKNFGKCQIVGTFFHKSLLCQKNGRKKLPRIWRVSSEKTEIVQLFTCVQLSTDFFLIPLDNFVIMV